MNIIRGAIRLPHLVTVVTLLVVLFGWLSLRRVPLQMRPTIDRPLISISTSYLGASPQEVEDKITRPIEEMLNSVEGLKEMSSSSMTGSSRISLEFDWGVDRDAAMVEVLNRLGRVRALPEEATTPVAQAVNSDSRQAIMWIGLQATEKRFDSQINRMREVVETLIEPQFRRVNGVGGMIISGGQRREIQIVIDQHKMTAKNISLRELISTLRKNYLTVRGGPLQLGKRDYIVWTSGRQNRLAQLRLLLLKKTKSGVVRLSDVAKIRRGLKRKSRLMRLNGRPGIALGIMRKTGANVPQTAAGVEREITKVNRELKQKGLPYQLTRLYTEVTYIDQSLALVQTNLLLGAGLAVLVLLLFLGSWRSVLVIGLSIPVSLVSVFIIIDILGRSLNIVSLAGLAFAVGMVVDNAIVVLENIYRKMGTSSDPDAACEHGTTEVALAVVASTVTTAAVFLPIVFLKSEAGQIYKDIALAISFAVVFSLVISLTLIPMLSRLILRLGTSKKSVLRRGIDGFGGLIGGAYRWLLRRIVGPGKAGRRLALVFLVAASFVFSLSLLPDAEYLPSGNRNLILALAKPIAGTSLEKISEAVKPLEKFVLSQKETARIFTVFTARFNVLGVILKTEHADEKTSANFLKKLRGRSMSVPGFRYIFPVRATVFRSPAKQFQVRIYGPSLDRLNGIANIIKKRLQSQPGVARVRSDFERSAPIIEVSPRIAALSENGIYTDVLATNVQVALGGLRIGYFLEQGRERDLTLIGDESQFNALSDLGQIPVLTNSGKTVYLSDIGRLSETVGPTRINRREMLRSITLTVNLKPKASLGGALKNVDQEIIGPMRRAIPADYTLALGGAADRLKETLDELSQSLMLALLISYLLMVALFRSFLYPFIIATTVPMAATGAFIAVGVTDTSFDTITMLGFVILSGIVVNNAILIVHQTLNLRREGIEQNDAIIDGACSRLRPIFMTAITSVLGMLPLAIGKGAGSELYRGLGIAIVGGLLLSTFVTIFLVPALMALFDDARTNFWPAPKQPERADSIS